MPAPRFRSRTFRRINKKLPGGEVVVHHERRKPKVAKCSKCKGILKGIPRELPIKMRNLAASKKTVERPYGGSLCSKCSRELLKSKARV
jgi:large subunit ribosomal protein L34e